MTSTELLNAVSLIASIASLILGIVAIWLSVVFYKMATESSNKVDRAAADIQSGVDRLQKLFDVMYSDIFGLMKDTVNDMRKQVLTGPHATVGTSEDQIYDKLDEKLSKLRGEIQSEFISLVEKVGETDSKMHDVVGRVQTLVDSAIRGTRRAEDQVRSEAKLEAGKYAILRILHSTPHIRHVELYRQVRDIFDGPDVMHQTLLRLQGEGLIRVDGGGKASTEITLLPTKANLETAAMKEEMNSASDHSPS